MIPGVERNSVHNLPEWERGQFDNAVSMHYNKVSDNAVISVRHAGHESAPEAWPEARQRQKHAGAGRRPVVERLRQHQMTPCRSHQEKRETRGESVNKKFYSLSLSALATGLGAACAQAQEVDQEASSAGAIETVVVTATRRQTEIMETPIAVSAMTQEQMTQLGLDNIDDLSYALPGFSVQNTDTSAPVITLRGVRSNNVTEVGDPAVGIHVDGLYVPRPQGAAALMFDLERAELARGPQGTLFGRNSIVGTLNIVTAKPNFEEQAGSVTLGGGRFGEESLRAFYNLPVNDRFALRFAYMSDKRDSFLDGYYDGSQPDWRFLPQDVRNQFQPITSMDQKQTSTDYSWYLGCQSWQTGCYADPGWQIGNPQTKVQADPETFYNNADNQAFRVSGRYLFNDGSDLNLQYELFQDNGAGWQNMYSCEQMALRSGKLQGDPAVYDANTCEDIMGTENRYTSFVNTPGIVDMEIQSTRAIYNKSFGDVDMVAKWGNQKLTQYSQWDTDGGANAAYDMAMIINDYVAKSNVFDIEFQSTWGDLAWVVGAFYMKEDNDMEAFFHATLNGDNIFKQPNRTIESRALFGQGTYALRDDLFLTLGLRYTEDKKQDIGGRTLECSVWNSCYPSTEVWGQRQLFPQTLNALTPDFHLAGGLYDGENCTAAGGPYGGGPYLGGTGCMVQTAVNDASAEFDNTDWRIGLDWDVSDTGFLYGYVASGFKAGSIADQYVRGANTLHPDGPGSRVDTSYGPEEAITGEIGYKVRLFENSLNLSANYYYTIYDGKQFTGNVPVDTVLATEYDRELGQVVDVDQVVTIWGTQNFGEQKMTGLELEWDWIPYAGGRFSGWATFMDTEITEDFITQWYYGMDAQFGRADYSQSIANVPENAVNLRGNEAPYSPDQAFTIRYEHTFDLGRLGLITPSINYHWQAEDYLTIWNADKHVNDPGGYGTGFSPNGDYVDLPGYFQDPVETFGDSRDDWNMLDVFLTYKPSNDSPWYLQAYAYNVTEEQIAWWRGVEAGQPRGSYSAPSQIGARFGFYW
jgi:iron complex outermembrane receptor protein